MKVVIFLIILVLGCLVPYVVGSIVIGPGPDKVVSKGVDTLVIWLIGLLVCLFGLSLVLASLFLSGLIEF